MSPEIGLVGLANPALLGVEQVAQLRRRDAAAAAN
jgi:hypothetical protein